MVGLIPVVALGRPIYVEGPIAECSVPLGSLLANGVVLAVIVDIAPNLDVEGLRTVGGGSGK